MNAQAVRERVESAIRLLDECVSRAKIAQERAEVNQDSALAASLGGVRELARDARGTLRQVVAVRSVAVNELVRALVAHPANGGIEL